MSSRFIGPFFDVGSGIKPSDGARLFFFETGTSTPKDTFSDQLIPATPNSNPVIADSKGVFGDIFIDGIYKVVLEDKNSVQIWEADPVKSLIEIDEAIISEDNISTAIAAGASGDVGDFVNTSEYKVGTGLGAGRYQLTDIDPGFPLINPQRADGLWLNLLHGNSIDLEQAGADHTGSVDAGAAMTQIINSGQQVTSESAGVFNVASLSSSSHTKIDLQGPFSLVGVITNAVFASNEDFSADKITCSAMKYLIGNDSSSTGQVLNISRFHITGCKFSNMNWACRIRTFAAFAANKVGENVIINDNDVDTAGSGFVVNAFIFGYEIKNNTFANIGGVLSIDEQGQMSGISIGQDNSASIQVLANTQGNGEVHNNRLNGITNTSVLGGQFTNFIQVFGSQVEIHGNHGKDLVAAAGTTDSEGIYFKGSNNNVHDNTLEDCGYNEGAIIAKGVAVGSNGIATDNNEIHNNIIRWEILNDRNIAIKTLNGRANIHDNIAVNGARQVIICENSPYIQIHNNMLFSCQLNGTVLTAINALDPIKASIHHNFIEVDGGNDGNAFGIQVSTTANAIEQVDIEANEYALTNEGVAATGSVRPVRIFDNGNGIDRITISGEKFGVRGAVRDITCISTTITGAVRSAIFKGNINDSETSGTLTDIIFAVSPTSLFAYSLPDNPGFTTNLNPLPTFANNAAAIVGGLVAGQAYAETGTDPLRVAEVF